MNAVGKIVVSLIISCFLFVSPAQAGAAWVYENGAPEHGTANAGSAARASDAATAWYNPAGMTRLDSTQFMVGVVPIFSSAKFDPGPLTSVSGGGGGDAGGFLPAASFNFVHDTTENFKWGIGFGALVGVQFADVGLAFVFGRQRFNRRGQHAARPAPRSPEVDQDGRIALQNRGIPGGVSDVQRVAHVVRFSQGARAGHVGGGPQRNDGSR